MNQSQLVEELKTTLMGFGYENGVIGGDGRRISYFLPDFPGHAISFHIFTEESDSDPRVNILITELRRKKTMLDLSVSLEGLCYAEGIAKQFLSYFKREKFELLL